MTQSWCCVPSVEGRRHRQRVAGRARRRAPAAIRAPALARRGHAAVTDPGCRSAIERPVSVPISPLRDSADQHRPARCAAQRRDARSQRQVVVEGLAEADARVDDDGVGGSMPAA